MMNHACIPIGSLSDIHSQQMLDLMQHCYVGVQKDSFLNDLRQKDYALILFDPDSPDRLIGFSTFTFKTHLLTDLESIKFKIKSRHVDIFCSGDTIIHPNYWGSSYFGKSLLQTVIEFHSRTNAGSLWWLLITSGPRTWGVLPMFFQNYFPNPSWNGNISMDSNLWIHYLGHKYWGELYNENSHIVKLDNPYSLGECIKSLPEPRGNKKEYLWYNLKNPQWNQGDELVSVTEISRSNLSRAGLRYLKNTPGLD